MKYPRILALTLLFGIVSGSSSQLSAANQPSHTFEIGKDSFLIDGKAAGSVSGRCTSLGCLASIGGIVCRNSRHWE